MSIIKEFNLSNPQEAFRYCFLKEVHVWTKIFKDELVITRMVYDTVFMPKKHKIFDTASSIQDTWDAILTYKRFKEKGVWSWIKENFC